MIVSVVLVTWNSARFLPECLRSLSMQSLPSERLVVVDNGSTDESVRLVRAAWPGALIVEQGENTGYSHANNEGIARAGGDAVLLLNSDIILEPDYLERAAAVLSSGARVGSVQGKLLRYDGVTLDTTGQFLSRGRRVRERGYGERDRGQHETAGPVFSVCTAAALLRREMIEDVSLAGRYFDDRYFAYGEDLEAGWRARNAGWIARYEPLARARHYRGGSAGAPRRRFALLSRPGPLRVHILKNRWLTLLMNDRPRHWLRDLPWILPQDLMTAAAAVISGPRVSAGVMRSVGLWPGALRRRRDFFSRLGRHGARIARDPMEAPA